MVVAGGQSLLIDGRKAGGAKRLLCPPWVTFSQSLLFSGV
jgi:hypothetical protein